MVLAANAVIFDCDFAYLTSGEIFVHRYACRMIGDNITMDGSTSLIQVNGEHAEGQTHSNVRMVYANKQTEPCKLPKDMKNFFPNLDGIKWVHGSLSTIDAEDLDFPNLDLLDLLDNKLVSLPSDLFRNSPKLQWIQFDDNAIVHVGRNFFDALEEIKSIRFRSNLCMNSMASTPEEIENLKSELLNSCSISPAPLSNLCMMDACLNEQQMIELFGRTDKHKDEISELNQLLISQNGLISKLQTQLEKVENVMKFCQCTP